MTTAVMARSRPVTTTASTAAPVAATTAATAATTTEHGRYAGPPTLSPSEMAGRRTILMVEDETSITEPLAEALDREGFATRVAGTVADAISAAEEEMPDLVLLDVMLPDGSGYDVARSLRDRSNVPIIMLTARGEETDRVVGLELGADDYIVKPFSAREVAARIRAVLRRAGDGPGATTPAKDKQGPLEVGPVKVDP